MNKAVYGVDSSLTRTSSRSVNSTHELLYDCAMDSFTLQGVLCMICDEQFPPLLLANCTLDIANHERAWPNGDTWTSITFGVGALCVAILQLLLGNRVANAINCM
jgi:hypothetical protein